MKMTEKLLAGVASLGLSVSAFAAGPDVTAITSAVSDVGAVAAAVFAVYVAIKAAKFIRRAL